MTTEEIDRMNLAAMRSAAASLTEALDGLAEHLRDGTTPQVLDDLSSIEGEARTLMGNLAGLRTRRTIRTIDRP